MHRQIQKIERMIEIISKSSSRKTLFVLHPNSQYIHSNE
jgi:hypothetical protein